MTNKEETVNILLVDDRPDKLLALEVILSPLGQNLVKAQSGKDALRLLLHEEFAVILLDINMPEMDGFETAFLIRQRESTKDVPIIFISALEPSDDRVRKAYSLHAVDYVPSPGAPEVLCAKVSVFVDLHLKARRLQRVSEELQLKNEQLQTFCYAIAHDLRAPLRTLQSFPQILRQDYAEKLDEHGKDMLNRIGLSASRMDTLIVDLLKFIRSDHIDLPLEKLCLKEVITTALDHLADEINGAKASVVVKEPLLPVCGHRETTIHILINLICNAITFVADGKKPEIQISSQVHGDMVRIAVRDNGLGIDPQYHEKVFNLFERLQPGKHLEGTGVGLAIVKVSVKRMGGRVGVESVPEGGSVFWFELARP